MLREFWIRQNRLQDARPLWTATWTTMMWWALTTMFFIQDVDRHDYGRPVSKWAVISLIGSVLFGIWQTAGVRRRILELPKTY